MLCASQTIVDLDIYIVITYQINLKFVLLNLKRFAFTKELRVGSHRRFLAIFWKLPFHFQKRRFIHESKISESEIYFFVALFEECATKF